VLRDVVAIVDGLVHPFELGVACEVFGIDRSDDGLPRFDFAVCATGRRPLPGPGGMSLHTSYGLDRAANADLVVIPACHTRDQPPPRPVVDLLRDTVARGAWLLSVCSGAFLLAAAGLLDDRRATCHWHDAGLLASRFPHLALEPDIAQEIEREWPGARVAIHHRIGSLSVGETAVAIAVAAAHRAAAFEACRAAIDRIKQRAPIWKKEIGERGEAWVGFGS